MPITIMCDSWKDECIEVVFKDYMKWFPNRAKGYLSGIRDLHRAMRGETVWTKAKTMCYVGKIPAEVLRMIQFNWPEFMNGSPRQMARDYSRFLRVVSDAVLRPRAAGLIVPSTINWKKRLVG